MIFKSVWLQRNRNVIYRNREFFSGHKVIRQNVKSFCSTAKVNCASEIQEISYSCLFKKYESFIGTRCQIFPCNVFGNGGIKSIRITERGSSGVRGGLSQSRLRYSRAVRTPRRADLFENPRKWHVSPVVRRLATLYAPRRCLSPSRHPPPLPPPRRAPARSLLFPRASNASLDLLPTP